MSNNIEHKNSINSNEWNKWIQEANSIKEIVHEHQIGFHNNIIRFYGITDKIMKIKLASKLSSAVLCLHDKGIVHRDLHSNNVLIHQNAIKLADLGLSKRIQESNIQSKLYEMVAYVDPKMFNHVQTYSLNKKSDIYSIGVLFWEISSGRPPFCNEPCDGGNLATKILHGLREAPIPGTLECCINIHTDCWNSEPDNRPAINQVVGRLKTLNTSNNKCNSNVDIQLSSEQQLNLKSNVFEVSKDIIYSSHCSHENLSQFIRNFDKINIKEIEPLTSIIPINIIVDEILYILNKLEKVDERREILNYLNNYNMTPQEIYYWLLNNQDNSNSVLLLGVFYYLGIGC
ncbi:kinase-like domain-containing protein [Rhizophagus clarus]|uniref:Kinase-like domain-containing protein n=1 Tax=Rhizophagus clarus TaxID=94130 RepID=A0A8H3QXM4_9GLOM|nr:kinase-like domain-containing protein [Rhizophagus clarus]